MCPSFMPLQKDYKGAIERTILDAIISNYRDLLKEDYRYPIDYHAHIVRTIYQLVMRTYDYHYEEVREPFSIIKVVGNSFAVELYDVRCTDVKTAYFPNLCHLPYKETVFDKVTDIVAMHLNTDKEYKEPFEHWATAPPPKQPRPGDITPTPPPVKTAPRANRTVITYENGTTTEIIYTHPPTTTPEKYSNCTSYSNASTGKIQSPNYPRKYPPNARCKWVIETTKRKNIYIKFNNDNFELEYDRKCGNDFVEVRDGDENGPLLAKYCGQTYATPRRSGREKLTIIFRSDSDYHYKGFEADWYTLEARVSIGCITYNPMATLPKSKINEYDLEMKAQNPSDYVPVSRLLACQQHPKCDRHKNFEKPLSFTFEHFRYDRNDKKCVRWSLTKFGRSFDTYDCWKIKSNKTHTECECKSWGIVGVMGRITNFNVKEGFKQYSLGTNSFVSVIVVILALIATLIFLFLKDQWGAVIIQIFTRKEYDSGRVIQLHIVFGILLTEIIFSITTFNVEGTESGCFVLGFIFYYLLQTVFCWLFIYALFLQSRVQEIFDSQSFNSYKIYLIIGYSLPFLVTLTVSGLDFQKGDMVQEKLCWLLFKGTTVWGFSGVVITLGLATIILLIYTIHASTNMENGIILQEKCIRILFTTFFALMTTIFGAQVLDKQTFGWEYMFSMCNLLQGFSLTIMYCILRREDPIIKANQIGPVPDFDVDEKDEIGDLEERPEFKDMDEYISEEENEDGAIKSPSKFYEKPPRTATKVRFHFDSEVEEEKSEVIDDAAVDTPNHYDSGEDEDQEIMFRIQNGDDYV